MTDLGPKIKKLRELRNYTQEYMAHKLSMSQVNYSRIERNEIRVKPGKLEQIASLLGLAAEQLLSFDEKVIFSIPAIPKGSPAPQNPPNTYCIDARLEKIYEDKIRLLEEKIRLLEGRQGEDVR